MAVSLTQTRAWWGGRAHELEADVGQVQGLGTVGFLLGGAIATLRGRALVVAAVVPRAGAVVTEAEVMAHLAPRLARYKQPREFIHVQALPRTPTGKINRRALREAHRRDRP